MRQTLWICGDHGSVVLALEIVVAVVDRRVLRVHVAEEVGLITCVWSWVSHSARHPTPASRVAGFSLKLLPMNVVDAEGLGSERVGEDRTCGKEQ